MSKASIVTRLDDRVAELSSVKITGSIVDLDEEGFKPVTLTLLLYDAATGEVINDRNRQSILDENGGEVTAAGALTLELSPDDNEIIGSLREERHIALLEWSWESASRKGKHEIHITVRNLDNVPAS